VIGVNAFMGGRETTQTKYIVQMAGSAIKADAQPLEEFDRNKELRDVLLSSGQYASNSCTEELSKEQMNQTKDAPPTILMIELDDDTRPILKHNLRNWGYWVIEALQEEDAVALARGVRDCPGLILIDQVELSIDDFLNMGQRIRQGAELSSRPPIVVMAEQYGEDMEDKDVQVGESEYVTYLEDGEQLRSLLHRLCPV
jgi:PleD family two-component response regulator